VAVLIQAERFWLGQGKIERGMAMRVEDGHVLEIGPWRRLVAGRAPGEVTIDFGRTVLMPGLINLHTHLELGWLRNRVPARGGFTHWVRELRRQQNEARATLGEKGLRDDIVQAIRLGERELLHYGTTTFFDVSNSGLPAEHLSLSGIRAFAALECLGLDAHKAPATLARAREYVEAKSGGRIERLAVPHALYSCSADLLRGLKDPKLHKGHASMHLLESVEEMELFQSGFGPLRTMVDEICPEHDLFMGESAIERLEKFYGPPGNFLAVHGYAMNASELQTMARLGASIALCPSSRAFYLHPSIAINDLIRLKINVGLGTDSLASSPSLSLWHEMAQLSEDHPDLEPGRILSWATEGGARALNIRAGKLAPGYWADWIGVDANDVPDEELEDYLVREQPQVKVVAVAGDLLLDERWEGE
jgi:cytosine/adenosine deaminase-related metal-dependent hydrolase